LRFFGESDRCIEPVGVCERQGAETACPGSLEKLLSSGGALKERKIVVASEMNEIQTHDLF